jgi:Fe2+ or Zn2+ uptake regulation protein
VCQICGAVDDLDEDLTNDLATAIEHRYSFRPSFSHVSIFGTCSRCRS